MFDELGRAIAQGLSFFAAQFVLGDAPWSPDGRSLIAGCWSSGGGLYLFSLEGGATRAGRRTESGSPIEPARRIPFFGA